MLHFSSFKSYMDVFKHWTIHHTTKKKISLNNIWWAGLVVEEHKYTMYILYIIIINIHYIMGLSLILGLKTPSEDTDNWQPWQLIRLEKPIKKSRATSYSIVRR